jgi:long-chain acyl-CoA synthetase
MSSEIPFWTEHYPRGVLKNIDEQIRRYNSLNDAFNESCEKFALKPAFTNHGTTLTFAEVNRKAECFAAFLQNRLQMKKGDRIAIQLPNLLQYPVALFGALKAGLIVVNTNPLYTDREMKHQFNDSGCTAVLILANFASHLQNIIHETKIQHIIITEIGDMMGFPKRLVINAAVKYVKRMVPTYSLPDAIPFCQAMKEGAALSLRPVPMQPDDIAFLQYTGGTTGVAKGAMLTHRNLVANMEQIKTWMYPRLIEGEETAICALPLYHIFALTLNGMALGRYGVHNILITNPRDLAGLVKEMKKYPFTMMNGVNTLFNGLMNFAPFSTVDFSKLKISVAGGMALQTSVALRWLEMTKSKIIEGYGLTETSPVACCNPTDGSDQVGTVGPPLPSTFVKILAEDGAEVQMGEAGELVVRGPQVMKGYWQRDDETAKVMLAGGWLKTGDMATMDKNGFCRIVDRKKDMIIVSGFNVYPNEVEDVLAGLPGVLEVAAIGIPNEKSGEVVKVFIVKKDASLTEQDVIAHARLELTSYKVPKFVEFRKELPKTNVGKILRRALKEENSR